MVGLQEEIVYQANKSKSHFLFHQHVFDFNKSFENYTVPANEQNPVNVVSISID